MVATSLKARKVEAKKESERDTFNYYMPVLGFTGPMGSGCSTISTALAKKLDFKHYKLSDIIKSDASIDPNDDSYVEKMQNKGNELRKENGNDFLILQVIEQALSERNIKGIIIDGIKNTGEIPPLKSTFINFFLFSVHAYKEDREKRLLEKKVFKSKEDFYKSDERDQYQDLPNGQQVKECDGSSDIIIVNNHIPPRDKKDRESFINMIKDRYVEPILKYSKYSEETINASPTIDEICMAMAYATSKMSECAKRKVGAVIVKENRLSGNGAADGRVQTGSRERHVNMMIPTVVSSGYNEVPLGSEKCVYHPTSNGCYRDYLQKQHAVKIKHCPNCGEAIEKDKTASGYIPYEFMCKCGEEIFKEFVPGAKMAPGKLLDMCRALHAEETAILKLNNNDVEYGRLVLYTTTQPCNLCANKIVNAGIQKVVFSEPYMMKEADVVLKNAGIEVVRFEGIKSNAFFKLYS